MRDADTLAPYARHIALDEVYKSIFSLQENFLQSSMTDADFFAVAYDLLLPLVAAVSVVLMPAGRSAR